MRKLKMILMSLMTFFVCGLATSCADDVVDAIMGNDEYFIVLDNVDISELFPILVILYALDTESSCF